MRGRVLLIAAAVALPGVLAGCDRLPATAVSFAETVTGSAPTTSAPPTGGVALPPAEAQPTPTDGTLPTDGALPTDGTVPTTQAVGSPAAGWPSAATPAVGAQYYAVYLALSRGDAELSELQAAHDSVAALGYSASVGELCATGAQDTFSLDPTITYTSAELYFTSAAAAQQFVDLYQPGVVGTALVTVTCVN